MVFLHRTGVAAVPTPVKNAPSGTRTPDQLIKSQLLYRLS
jgi:hypothetical protein